MSYIDVCQEYNIDPFSKDTVGRDCKHRNDGDQSMHPWTCEHDDDDDDDDVGGVNDGFILTIRITKFISSWMQCPFVSLPGPEVITSCGIGTVAGYEFHEQKRIAELESVYGKLEDVPEGALQSYRKATTSSEKANADESRSEWGITRLLTTQDEKLEAKNRWIAPGKKAKHEKDGEGLPAST